MPASLSLSGVAVSFGAHPLFAGLDAVIAPGDVTALVGPNGSGKTTLLRAIAGEIVPDTGTIRLAPRRASVGYLPQSLPDPDETIAGYVRRRTGVAAATLAFETAAQELATGDAGADEAYAHALERWLNLGSADLDIRLDETLARVGLAVPPDRPLGALSGGQAARAALASILVSRYDVLLLDEPTNNLDATGREALTEFVRAVRTPVLIASHDRALLDEVATNVIELDYHQQAVAHYTGGWSDYREARALARRHAEEAYETYVEQRDALAAQADRQTRWAAKGRAKAAQLGPGTALAKQHKENKARRMDQRAARARDAARRLPEVDQPRREWELRYTIAEAPPPAEVVLTLDRVVVRNGSFTLGPVSAQIVRGDRVALVGDNGSGKTTLLSAILGDRTIEAGRISWGTRVHRGMLDQERTIIAGAGPLLDRVMALLSWRDEAETRRLLAKFALGVEHIGHPCDSLSLGERTRAALALLQARDVNVLILDEPTNHLDVVAIEQLQAALTAFGGTVLIVTHDRALAEAVRPTRQWSFTGGGAVIVREHPGT